MQWPLNLTRMLDAIRALSPTGRLALGAACLALFAGLAYLGNQQVSSADCYLLDGELFSATQLREIQAALGKAGLESQVEGAKVKVPRGQEAKYMAALASSGALADFGSYMKQAVSGNNLMLYGPQQEARAKVALLSELQLAICRMPGIESAFVHIDQESRRGFRETSVISASVAVQPRGNRSLDDAMVAAIRGMVAAARVGLRPESVTVVDLSGPRLFAGNGGDPKAAASAGSYADHKKRLELDWQEKIGRLLEQIAPGALVTTNVELEREVTSEEKSTEYAERASETRGGAPTTEKHIVREGRTPKRVTVSVAVPHTYYEQVWRKRHVSPYDSSQRMPRDGELAEIEIAEKKNIEAAIAPLLGNADQATDGISHVAVTTFYPLAVAPPAQPLGSELVRAWLLANWRSVGVGLFVVLGFMTIRNALRATRPVRSIDRNPPLHSQEPHLPRPHAVARSREAVHSQAFSASSDHPSREKSAASGGLREELSELVRVHPDSAASLLRTWIGNAG